MKTLKRFAIVIIVLGVAGLIWGLFFWNNRKFTLDELKNLNGVDQIKIFHDNTSTGEGYFVKTVEDPKQIRSIIEIFHHYADGWGYTHWPASPPGPLTVEFYKGKEVIMLVDVTHYIPASGSPSFFLSKFPGPNRSLEEYEFKEIMNILEIDENLAQMEPSD